MRFTASCILAIASSAVFAQLDPYAQIERAVDISLRHPQVIVDVGGSMQLGNRPAEQYRLRTYIQGKKMLADAFVNDERRLMILADGAKVWRYDPIKNEYTYLSQPETIQKTFGVAVAWARSEMQRPLRLLAQSSRWLINPTMEQQPNHVRLHTVVQVGNEGDWRGTDLNFYFSETSGAMQSFTIRERIDMPGRTLKVSDFMGTFLYPETFTYPFTFTPPRGSKPAADLPSRIG
ncbi:MAG: hypothetical protein H0W86_02215 [Armatimonadetes bacterium]|nr:hypothetical protein [Armatimonadota bacterium]